MFSIILRRALGLVAFLAGITIIGWFIYNQFWPTKEFKSSSHSWFQLIVPVLFVIFGWHWLRYEGKGIEEVIPPDLKCPELDASIVKAQETLPAFMAETEKGIDNAFVKFPMQTPQGLLEHIWGYVHFYKDGVFNVSLANEPIDEKAEKGGRRNIPTAEVEDWQIMQPDGKIKGAYSLVALFEYWERQGKPLSPRMKKQKAELLEAC